MVVVIGGGGGRVAQASGIWNNCTKNSSNAQKPWGETTTSLAALGQSTSAIYIELSGAYGNKNKLHQFSAQAPARSG